MNKRGFIEARGNIHYGIKKPRFTGVDQQQKQLSPKQQWKLNCIPYFGYLSFIHKRGRLDAFDLITKRYIRFYGVIWPDEYKAYLKLFMKKHPEINGSRAIHEKTFDCLGACWDYKRDMAMPMFGRFGLFDCRAVNPKPEKRSKVFLELVAKEMRAIKRRG